MMPGEPSGLVTQRPVVTLCKAVSRLDGAEEWVFGVDMATVGIDNLKSWTKKGEG